MKRGFRPPLVYRQVRRQVLHLTPPQALILSFVGLSLVGTVLLKLPMASNSPTKISNAVSWSVAPEAKSIIASDNAPQIALSTIAGIATEGLAKSACDGTKIGFA